jgi:hypothetical protein
LPGHIVKAQARGCDKQQADPQGSAMDMNHLFLLEQRITQLETTLPGLRIAQRRHPHVASFESDIRNREFQIANLKGKLQRLHERVTFGGGQ